MTNLLFQDSSNPAVVYIMNGTLAGSEIRQDPHSGMWNIHEASGFVANEECFTSLAAAKNGARRIQTEYELDWR